VLWPIENAVHSRDVEQRLMRSLGQVFRLESDLRGFGFATGQAPVDPDVAIPESPPVPWKKKVLRLLSTTATLTYVNFDALLAAEAVGGVDTVYSGNINDYSFVFLHAASTVWADIMAAPSWVGRIIASGENPIGSTSTAARTQCRTIATDCGLTNDLTDAYDAGSTLISAITADPLTAGVSSIRHAGTGAFLTAGGFPVLWSTINDTTPAPNVKPACVHARFNDTSVVLIQDLNFFGDAIWNSGNAQFVTNCLNVYP